MNSRERILAAIIHQEPDRVPVWYAAEKEIADKLCRHFGVSDRPALRDKLGCDTFAAEGTWIHGEDAGPKLYEMPDGSKADFFGIVIQKHWPQAFAETVADLERYRWPIVDWFDFPTVNERWPGSQELSHQPAMEKNRTPPRSHPCLCLAD